MGKIRDWASQASGPAPTEPSPHAYLPWLALMGNPQGWTPVAPAYTADGWGLFEDFFGLDTTDHHFNFTYELFHLREANGNNIYEDVAAYNPDVLIARVERAINDFRASIDDIDPQSTLTQAVTLGKSQAARLLGDGQIDGILEAFEARQRIEHLAAVSRTLAGLWEAGAILTTQTFGDLAMLEDGFQRTLATRAAQLEDQRVNLAAQILAMSVSTQQQLTSLRQVYVVVAMDALRHIVTVKQDQQDKDLDLLHDQKFWNFNLLTLALNATSSVYGAQMAPRQQTKGERLMATITGAIGMGVQGGTAAKSPQAGIAMGGLSLLGQGLLM